MRQDNTLKNFISVYDNVISESSCRQIIQESSNAIWIDQYFDSNGQSISDGMKTCFKIGTKSKLILDTPIKNTIDAYIKSQGENLFTLKGMSPIRLNKFEANSKMRSHIDHQPVNRLISDIDHNYESGIPILTLVGILNDDFEGGEFVFWDNYVVPLKKGSIVIFPSNFLYSHKVNKITKGTRFSLNIWVW